MNADPDVARFVHRPGREDSLAASERIAGHWDEHGFGLWAVRATGAEEVLGFAGLSIPSFFPPVLPAVEVGWRLRRDAWGNGYATEAGAEALRLGFEALGLDEVISLVAAGNERSLAVCSRLGMGERERLPHPETREEVVVLGRRASR